LKFNFSVLFRIFNSKLRCLLTKYFVVPFQDLILLIKLFTYEFFLLLKVKHRLIKFRLKNFKLVKTRKLSYFVSEGFDRRSIKFLFNSSKKLFYLLLTCCLSTLEMFEAAINSRLFDFLIFFISLTIFCQWVIGENFIELFRYCIHCVFLRFF